MPGWDSSGRKRQLRADDRATRRMFAIFVVFWLAAVVLAVALMLGWP